MSCRPVSRRPLAGPGYALIEWLDELDAKQGAPTAQQLADADAFLDTLERGDTRAPGAA
jgi:hypothetical protein